MGLAVAVLFIKPGRFVVDKLRVIRPREGDKNVVRRTAGRDNHLVGIEVKERGKIPFQGNPLRFSLFPNRSAVNKEAVFPPVGLGPPGVLVESIGRVLAVDVVHPVLADIVVGRRGTAEMGVDGV